MPPTVLRLNAFLESYAAACEAQGDVEKAVRVRQESIPVLPFLHLARR